MVTRPRFVSPLVLLGLCFSLLASSVLAANATAPTVCNGHAEFCSRSYSNVSVIGAHDSYSVGKGNPGANQNYTVEQQLNDGIRMLQVQGHMNNGSIHLCHTTCLLLDAGTFTSYLTTVASWLAKNPNEVVTILIVNTDGILPSVWAQSYTDAGLTPYIYTPASVPIAYDAWPTLGEMIQSGGRLVNFLAQNADVSSVSWLIDEFTNIWETPFDQTDNSFPCTVDRVTGTYNGKMYLINHFLDVNLTLFGEVIPVPATAAVGTTNGLTGTGSLTVQSNLCQSNWGYKPTFTLVDYYDTPSGDVFQYAATLNGVTYTAPSSTTSSGSSSKTTSNGGSVETGSIKGGDGSRLNAVGGGLALLAGVAAIALI